MVVMTGLDLWEFARSSCRRRSPGVSLRGAVDFLPCGWPIWSPGRRIVSDMMVALISDFDGGVGRE